MSSSSFDLNRLDPTQYENKQDARIVGNIVTLTSDFLDFLRSPEGSDRSGGDVTERNTALKNFFAIVDDASIVPLIQNDIWDKDDDQSFPVPFLDEIRSRLGPYRVLPPSLPSDDLDQFVEKTIRNRVVEKLRYLGDRDQVSSIEVDKQMRDAMNDLSILTTKYLDTQKLDAVLHKVKKLRGRWTPEEKAPLELWLSNNLDNRLPNEDELKQLIEATGKDKKQVQDWLRRQRKLEQAKELEQTVSNEE